MTAKKSLMDRIRGLSIPDENGCWAWKGYITSNGYGQIRIEQPDGAWKTRYAHRISYEAFIGLIPVGLDLDHKCRIRHCVNPDHLEPVSRSENMRRSPLMDRQSHKTHCKYGHVFTSDRDARGRRTCLQCRKRLNKEYRERHQPTAAKADGPEPRTAAGSLD